MTNFDLKEFYRDVESLNISTKVFEISSISEEGIKDLCTYIKEKIKNKDN